MVADKESLQLKFDFLFRTIDLCMGYRNPASGGDKGFRSPIFSVSRLLAVDHLPHARIRNF